MNLTVLLQKLEEFVTWIVGHENIKYDDENITGDYEAIKGDHKTLTSQFLYHIFAVHFGRVNFRVYYIMRSFTIKIKTCHEFDKNPDLLISKFFFLIFNFDEKIFIFYDYFKSSNEEVFGWKVHFYLWKKHRFMYSNC